MMNVPILFRFREPLATLPSLVVLAVLILAGVQKVTELKRKEDPQPVQISLTEIPPPPAPQPKPQVEPQPKPVEPPKKQEAPKPVAKPAPVKQAPAPVDPAPPSATAPRTWCTGPRRQCQNWSSVYCTGSGRVKSSHIIGPPKLMRPVCFNSGIWNAVKSL